MRDIIHQDYDETDTFGWLIDKLKPPAHVYKKYDDAFRKRTGICYVDDRGNEYTYNDLALLTRREDSTEELYKNLCGGTPEDALESGLFFHKCLRCGTWTYKKITFRSHDDIYCSFCTPLRTNGKIALWKDPYDDDRTFSSKKQAVFRPGVTTLIGCNGAGKTTLINNIKNELKKRGTPYIDFDNLGEEGGENGARNLLSSVLGGYRKADTEETLGFFSESLASSEGEKIISALNRFTSRISEMIRTRAGYGELWVLFDAIDSGLSVDMIEDVKKYLLDPLARLDAPDFSVYLILSSNSYEMSAGTMCFSIEKMRYIQVRTFESFCKAVKSSRKYKKKRDEVFRVKAEIAQRPYVFTADSELWKKMEESGTDDMEGDILTMELDPFRFVIHGRVRYGGFETSYRLFRREGTEWKKARCDIDDMRDRPDRLDEIKEDVHAYLCRKVFLYERGMCSRPART